MLVNKRILSIKLEKSHAFKQLIGTIKNITEEICIVFFTKESFSLVDNKNNIKSAGIRIRHLNEDKTILIDINLDGLYFKEFTCLKQKIFIRINTKKLHDAIRCNKRNDPIEFYMNSETENIIYFHKNNETPLEIHLIHDIKYQKIKLPMYSFQKGITMDQNKFLLTCENLYNYINDYNDHHIYTDIIFSDDDIFFQGLNIEGKIIKNDYVDYKDNIKIQGTYELKNLFAFRKKYAKSSTIDIYIRDDLLLLLCIPIDKLGLMNVYITPINLL